MKNSTEFILKLSISKALLENRKQMILTATESQNDIGQEENITSFCEPDIEDDQPNAAPLFPIVSLQKSSKSIKHKKIPIGGDLKVLRKFVAKQLTFCSICGDNFPAYLFSDHVMIRHAVKLKDGHRCDHCSQKIVGNSLAFVQHFKEHTKFEAGKKCPQCRKTFYTFKELEVHVEEHTELALKFTVRHYVCHHCGQQLRQRNNIKWHIISKHMENGMRCQFKVCGAYFLNEEELKSHEQRHAEAIARNGPPKYQCTVCNIKVDKTDKAAFCEQ